MPPKKRNHVNAAAVNLRKSMFPAEACQVLSFLSLVFLKTKKILIDRNNRLQPGVRIQKDGIVRIACDQRARIDFN